MKDMIARACKEVIALKLAAVDRFIEEVIEPVAEIGSPEKLIGKKYDDWTPQDKMMMSQVYGGELEGFIFDKEYEKVLGLEQEVST